MANKTIGEDFKIYKPAFDNTKRQLEGLSTAQGEKEYSQLKAILGDQANTLTANARGTRETIRNYGGEAVAAGNEPDIEARRLRAINGFNATRYDSERRFRDGIVTNGYSNALNMFTSQLGAETEVDLADLQGKSDMARAQGEMAFQARESELDRILARQQMQVSISQAEQQKKAERRKGIGGLLGGILGIGGALAAPFTGGASLALSGIGAATASRFAGGSSAGGY